MDLKLEFKSEGRIDRIRFITLEMPDGTDATVTWWSEMTDHSNGDHITLCSGLTVVRPNQPGQLPDKPTWHDLVRARLLDITWDGQGQITDLKIWAVNTGRNIMAPIDAYSTDFPSAVTWSEIDRGARGMVRYFNNFGLPTKLSCAGHLGTRMKRFWIEFQENVTDQDIARFMQAHTGKDHDFCANGMFCSRYDKPFDGNIVKTIQYTAPDTLSAMLDLTDWVADDMSGEPGHGATGHASMHTAAGTAATLCAKNIDPATAEAIYQSIRKDHIREDIDKWLQCHDEDLDTDSRDRAADLYVYDGRYDKNLSHWDNIANVIKIARDFA